MPPTDPPGDMAEAVWFVAPRRAEVRAEPLLPVGPHQARVRALMSAISHGTEMLVYRGQVPTELPLDLPTLRGSFALPIKYGYASVGRVEEVGAAVQSLAAGDLVFALHPHQSTYVIDASLLAKLPADLPPERGVFLANMETAVNVLLDAAPRLGERVVVFGQGTVGLLVMQLLRRSGVSLLVTVDPVEARRHLSQRLGADVSLTPGAALTDAMASLTDGQGADLAIEVSGQPAALDQAIDCLAFQGTVVVASWYGTKPASLHLGGAFHRRRIRLISSQVGAIDPALEPRWNRARRMALAIRLLSELPIDALISHRFPLSQAPDAYRLVDQHPEQVTQVLLAYGG